MQRADQKNSTWLESRIHRKVSVRFGGLRHEVASVAVGTESTGPNPMFCHRYPTRTCAWSNPGVGSSWDNEASPSKGDDSTVKGGRDC